MKNLFSRLRDVVWLSVVAVASGGIAVAAALLGADQQLIHSIAALGVITALLSLKQ